MDRKTQLPQELSPEIAGRFTAVDNTLIQEVKPDPKDRIEVEIGDSKAPETFHPQAKIKRWDNEVNFSARYVDPEPGEATLETEGNVVKYVKPKVEFHAYELDPADGLEDGGLEIELLLKEHPDTNRFDFTLETKGLEFFYQPALTPEEIEEGASRPDDVVGSYAVYHATQGGMNRADGMAYKTGKAFHIYRPFAHDANGDGIWCELNIDTETGILSVTIDEAFLKKAVYPVVVDPTFGYTSVGATTESGNYLSRTTLKAFTSTANAEIDSVSVYISKATTSANLKVCLWRKTGTSKGVIDINGVGGTTVYSTANWYTANYTAKPYVIDGMGHFAGFFVDTSESSTSYYDSESDSGGYAVVSGGNYSTPANFFNMSFTGRRMSIYATYTTAAYYPIPYFVSAGAIALDTSGAASTAPTMPTHQANDILLVAAQNSNSDAMSTATSGWTEITEINATGLGGRNIAWYWKRATGSGTAGPTITAAGTDQFAIGYVIRGCNTNITPYEDATTSGDGETAGATATPVTATIDTTGDNRLVLASYVNGSTSSWSSGMPPNGWLPESDDSTGTGDDARFTLISKYVPSAGSVSSETIGTLGLSTLYGALTLAFIPQPKTETLTDDFDDNSIDSGKWGETENNSATVTETGGQLVITPATSTVDSEGVLYSLASYDLTGSYVYVEAVQVATLADGWTGMNLYLDSSNEIGIEVSDETDLIAYQIVGGSFTSLASVTYNSSTMRWWRIRESGGTTYWEYSADGSSWSTLHSVANPIALTAVAPGLLVFENGSDASPGQAIFDNFNVEPSGGGGTVVQDVIGMGIIPFAR